ncbi:hypothetical protein BV25DRAFT_1988957 [Artomyces pyxidatus]|uniref:Uncharacterized protein n=1 Tax=Artomyces pyxidatus TaxID=48021 RepID=A0ACB8TAP7_9AGAM|nr:hypothetical protein BV25DRAFT_1988957 [Artomyces pyxidatus]
MASQMTYSDPSDEEAPLDRQASEIGSRRRSTRACDQCRRTKSKCQRYGTDEDPCHGCMTAGISCTYAGPSHKRGPPKGYIHAIERRLHQVEALMGTLIGSSDPRAQSLFKDLSKDPLARQVIHRVNHGPFGPKGRLSHPFGSTKEEFLAAIMKSATEPVPSPSSSRRSLSVKQSELSAMSPNNAWQARLQELLVSSAPAIPAELTHHCLGDDGRVDSPPSSASSRSFPPSASDDAGSPSGSNFLLQGRDDVGFKTNSLGLRLSRESLVAGEELGLYGKSSGLHLLKTHCNSNTAGSVFLCEPSLSAAAESLFEPQFPDPSSKAHLVTLYFEHVHPLFPALHRESFLDIYQQWSKQNTAFSVNASLGSHTSFRLLLLSMFALSSRFSNGLESRRYGEDARRLLHSITDNACIFTCQALVLLAYHDMGESTTVRAWNQIGSAIRMGQDLGLNRLHLPRFAKDLLSGDAEVCLRRHLWFGCCIAEKHISVLLDRSSGLVLSGRDALLFDAHLSERTSPAVYPISSDGELISSCFQSFASLTTIISAILELVYTVERSSKFSLRDTVTDLGTRLSQWHAELPTYLRDTSGPGISTPPPYVLQLHLHYWSAVILLYRSLLENAPSYAPSTFLGTRTVDDKRALAVCINAADEIIAIASVWESQFSFAKASPFVPGYLMTAGIIRMVAPLRDMKTGNLDQLQDLLQKIEPTWPTARAVLKVFEQQSQPTNPPDAPFTPSATIRLKRSLTDMSDLVEDGGRRMRPIPDALMQSPQLSQFSAPEHARAHVRSPLLGVTFSEPRDAFADFQWEGERVGGMEYAFPDTTLVSFPSAMDGEWPHHHPMDYVSGL